MVVKFYQVVLEILMPCLHNVDKELMLPLQLIESDLSLLGL